MQARALSTLFLKLRITPVLVLSALSVIGSLYLFISNQHDEEGWRAFGAIVLLVGGLLGFALYFAIRFVFRLRYLPQLLLELALLGLLYLSLKMN